MNNALRGQIIYSKLRISKKEVKEQKKKMQEVLQDLFMVVETEKTYEWAKVPRDDKDYTEIVNSITHRYGREIDFNYKFYLRFDFVCEKEKLIVEYDEKQHFTEARKITLMHYPSNIKLYYDKNLWIQACTDINAKMRKKKDPFRDEKRAFYDSVRDIESYKRGYRLIRIMHGQIDFYKEDAKEKFLSLVE